MYHSYRDAIVISSYRGFAALFFMNRYSFTNRRRTHKKKFALIWWANSSYKDVIEVSTFPKNDCMIDEVASLLWIEKHNGRRTRAQAKILAISGKYLINFIFNEGANEGGKCASYC